MPMQKDFWDARQFQRVCPLSTLRAMAGFVPPVRASQKPLIGGVIADLNVNKRQKSLTRMLKTAIFIMYVLYTNTTIQYVSLFLEHHYER